MAEHFRDLNIKSRWQEYIEEQYKRALHHPDNHDGVITDLEPDILECEVKWALDNHNGVITYLEPDILECEVKWALESITMNKASGGDGIPVEQFQILNDDAVKVLHSICQQIWETQQWPQD